MDREEVLAESLVELRTLISLTLTHQQVETVVSLWQNLHQFERLGGICCSLPRLVVYRVISLLLVLAAQRGVFWDPVPLQHGVPTAFVLSK